jgi:hypothetical protein
MRTLILKNLVINTSSNTEGVVLFNELKDAYLHKEIITLDIDGNLSLSSSFLNSSIGSFLEMYGLTEFKSIVKFRGPKSQFEKISEYINNYSELYLA